MFIDGLYKVTGFDVRVMVTGNAGIHEMMSIPFDELITVKRGQAIIGARITLPGELEKQYMFSKLEQFG